MVYKGIVIALVDIRYDKILTLIITVLLFLPSLIFAMFATMGRTNFKILVQHPSLLLMPTFTFFGFQRKTYGCFRKGGGETCSQNYVQQEDYHVEHSHQWCLLWSIV